MNFKDITKKAGRYFRRGDNIDLIRNPDRDWRWLLVGFTAAAMLVIVLDGYLFYEINAGNLFNAPPSSPATDAVDRTALKRVSDYYVAKQKELDAVKANPPVVPDPSR